MVGGPAIPGLPMKFLTGEGIARYQRGFSFV